MKRLKLVLAKIHFFLIIDGVKRAKYLKKKKLLKEMGESILFQSRNFPADPKCVILHNNIAVAADVTLVTHDAIGHVLLGMDKDVKYKSHLGCIEIMDNCFIGLGSRIMPNVRIGPNAIVAAGSIVTKDVPEGSIVGGCPARVIGSFWDLKKKRELESLKISNDYETIIEDAWKQFYENRQK